MLNLECPNCGRIGTVPKEKSDSRLVCKKCHTVFHLSPAGRVHLGEPPQPVKREPEEKPRSIWDPEEEVEYTFSLPELNITPAQFGLGLGAIGLLTIFYFISTIDFSEKLAEKADRMVAAFMAGDADTLKKFSTGESAEITEQWYDSCRGFVDDAKGMPAGPKPLVTVMVSEENAGTGLGQTIVYITVPKPTYRHRASDTAVLDPNDFYPPTQLVFSWVLERGLYWRLNGATLPPPPILASR
jgi:ribosomal protein S27AE